jgi:hypothetical protein
MVPSALLRDVVVLETTDDGFKVKLANENDREVFIPRAMTMDWIDHAKPGGWLDDNKVEVGKTYNVFVRASWAFKNGLKFEEDWD